MEDRLWAQVNGVLWHQQAAETDTWDAGAGGRGQGVFVQHPADHRPSVNVW